MKLFLRLSNNRTVVAVVIVVAVVMVVTVSRGIASNSSNSSNSSYSSCSRNYNRNNWAFGGCKVAEEEEWKRSSSFLFQLWFKVV